MLYDNNLRIMRGLGSSGRSQLLRKQTQNFSDEQAATLYRKRVQKIYLLCTSWLRKCTKSSVVRESLSSVLKHEDMPSK